jgi:hypothetical protein
MSIMPLYRGNGNARSLVPQPELGRPDWSLLVDTLLSLHELPTKDKGQETENQLAQLREFCAKQD